MTQCGNLHIMALAATMNMTFVDWLVLCVPIALVGLVATKTRRYTRSVADFMAASRYAGRYLVGTADQFRNACRQEGVPRDLPRARPDGCRMTEGL